MFTISKMNPEIELNTDSYKSLGEKLLSYGTRVLLICSGSQEDRDSLEKIKSQMTANSITFIQYNQLRTNLNRENLEQIIERAGDFSVSAVAAFGDFNQIMSGRYISNALNLPYLELPSRFYIPYTLQSVSIFSNRVGDNFEREDMPVDLVSRIIIDDSLSRNEEEQNIALSILSLLTDLAQLFLDNENNPVSADESRYLFNRTLDLLESGNLDLKTYYSLGITAAIYHGMASVKELYITLFSWMTGYRLKCNPDLICSKLLPWLLDEGGEHELSKRIQNLLIKYSFDGRLTDLGFSLEQLLSLADEQESTIKIIKKAF